MSDVFAEATVRISPSLTGFKSQLEEDLKKIMDKVKVKPIRIRPALSIGFIGSLKDQVNTAVASAQKGVKPIVIKTVVQTPSRRALADLVSAPVSLGAITGHVTPTAGPAGGITSRDQETINRLLKGNVQLLGLTEIAEEKVTKARQRGSAATKVRESQEDKLKRTTSSALELEKRLSKIEFEAATATGELAQAKKRLAIANEVEKKASALRQEQVSKETIRVQQLARAEQQLALDRVNNLDAAAAAARGGSGRTTTTPAARRASRAQERGFEALTSSVQAAREADAALVKLGKDTRDLASAQEILRDRQKILNSATRAYEAASRGNSAALRLATTRHLENARAAFADAQAQVKGLESAAKAQRAADKVAADNQRRTEAVRRQRDAAAARSASAERRRSEQLSRGGQASLLSLAGIRGATLAASRSFLVGAAAITVFAQAVRSFAILETNLDVFRATTSATAEQMEAVREEARKLGADLTLPSVSAGDAADAMVELAKAGLSVEDAMEGARAVLQLATGAAISNADATRLVANVLNAFSLSGREAAEVADTLANAANEAQGSIADIGTAFQQAASAGRQVGLSFGDTAAFLTILAKNGLRGSDAGTSLRTALIRLVNPSERAQEAFNKLGITLRDAQGNLRPDVFVQIADATSRLLPAQRDATIALIGGQDAFRAVTILGRQSIESFIAMRRALRQQGTAAELAAARTEGLHGALDGLKSVLETVGTEASSHVGPALADVVRSISSGITSLSESEQVATSLTQSLDAVGQGFDALGAAMQSVGQIAIPLADQLLSTANSIGVDNILAGVLAYKALTAVFDGAILRLKILKPLLAVVATARITANASQTAAALAGFQSVANAAGRSAEIAAASGFKKMDLTAKELQRTSAITVTRISALRAGLQGLRAGFIAAATSGTVLTIALAAAGAGLFYLLTRESATERALKRLAKATDEFAASIAGLDEARGSLGSTARAVNQEKLGLLEAQQAVGVARAAREAVAGQGGQEGSFARRKAELALAIALDDVTAATERLSTAEKERDVSREAAAAAEQRRGDAFDAQAQSLNELIAVNAARAQVGGRGPEVSEELAIQRAIEKTADQIKKTALEERKSADASVRETAKRKLAYAELIDSLNRPLTPTEIDIVFNSDSVEEGLRTMRERFRQEGNQAGVTMVDSILLGMGILPKRLRDFVDAGIRNAEAAARDGGKKIGDEIAKGVEDTLGARLQAVIADATRDAARGATRLIIAETEGAGLQAQLAIARDTLSDAERRFQAARRQLGRGETPSRRTEFDEAAAARAAAQDDVERIQEEIKASGEATIKAAEEAANERDSQGQRYVNAILEGRRATLLQRKITSAGLSETLNDDLKTNKIWLNFLRNQKKVILARLKAIGASKQVIEEAMRAISDLIFDTTNTVKQLSKDIADNVAEAQEILNSVIFQKIDLRIRIAQAREDVAAEIRLRRQRLALITKELIKLKHQNKKNTLAWLELKAAQVEEIAAIEDLQKQVNDRNNAFAELSFSFLQTQQGFAANLLSNLLPIGAIGNTVAGKLAARGGASSSGTFGGDNSGINLPAGVLRGDRGLAPRSPSRDLAGAAITSGAGVIAPPTRGQHATTNQLLNQILNVLRKSDQREKHPSSRRSERKNQSLPHGIGGV